VCLVRSTCVLIIVLSNLRRKSHHPVPFSPPRIEKRNIQYNNRHWIVVLGGGYTCESKIR
jgi:hypothetical protein